MSDLLLNPESEIVIFFGPRGKGKSSLMAHFTDEYIKTLATQRWELSEQLIRNQNVNRKTPLTFPAAPPIYLNTNYKLKTRAGIEFKGIPIEGKDIGVSNKDEKYRNLYPAPLIILDEAENEFSSKGEHLPKGQLKFLMQCRHYRIIMLLAAPRAVQIHKDIRASGSRFIEPRKRIDKFDNFKRLYQSTWHCREFLDTSAIEEYIATNGKSGAYVETSYTHNGDIRELYDGYEYEDDFYPSEGENFET